MSLETDARWKIDQALIGHERFALQFSGGKDSLTCLYLLKPWWDRLIVLWSNLGDPFPETLKQMDQIKAMVSQFHEIRGNSFESASAAFPVDLLPVRATAFGRVLEPEAVGVTLQTRWNCCWENFWLPMTTAVKELNITLLFRGQRTSEVLRAPIKPDSRDPSGARICLPIDDWQKSDVIAYLKANDVELPKFYEFMSGSPDCMHCTAYMDDQRGHLAYLRKFHPVAAKEHARRLALIAIEIAHGVEEMKRNILEVNGEAELNPLNHD